MSGIAYRLDERNKDHLSMHVRAFAREAEYPGYDTFLSVAVDFIQARKSRI
jgi:hypothetical protein